MSRAAPAGSDTVDWGGLGAQLTLIPNPFTIVSNGGRNVSVSKAVAGDFLCRCAFDVESLEAEIEKLKQSGRASFDLACTIDHDGKRAVAFTGTYVVHATHS